jgi:hypothetical protein
MSPRGKRLAASQVGQYAYCAQAWWLATVEKLEPADLEPIERGIRLHERHGWRVSLARGSNRLALVLLGSAAIVSLVWVIVNLL